MLAQRGRLAYRFCGGVAELHQRAGRSGHTNAVELQIGDVGVGDILWIAQHVVVAANALPDDFGLRIQELHPLRDRAGADDGGHGLADVRQALLCARSADSLGRAVPILVENSFRLVREYPERLPRFVGHRDDEHDVLTVRCFVHAVRRFQHRVVVRLSRQRVAGHGRVLQFPLLQPDLHAERRRAHDLPSAGGPARDQCGDAGERQLQPTGGVSQRRARRVRHSSARARHARQTATRLRGAVQHRLVCIRSPRTKAVHVTHHEFGVLRGELVQPQIHSRQCKCTVIADEHIRIREQPLNDQIAELGMYVQRHRAFAFVECHERWHRRIGGQTVVGSAIVPAGVAGGRLYLDHISTHVGKEQTGGGSLNGGCHFHNADVVQWSGHDFSPRNT